MSDPFFKTREETQAWLEEMGIRMYAIQDDLTVDVDGDVSLSNKNLTHIPVQFGVVRGNFKCGFNLLTSLVGSPRECHRFSCVSNLSFVNLDGAPEKCTYFGCSNNHLTSLAGGPKICPIMDCSYNALASLIGAPKACDVFRCYYNKLTNLIGGPEECNDLHCSNNRLLDLAGVAVNCQYLDCRENPELWDVSAAPDGCEIDYDRGLVAKNQAARQLVALDAGAPISSDTLQPKSGRLL